MEKNLNIKIDELLKNKIKSKATSKGLNLKKYITYIFEKEVKNE